MTPFQELRLWARRAPTGDRVSAAVAAAVAVGLLAWALIPPSDTPSNTVAGGAGTNQPAAGATGSATGASITAAPAGGANGTAAAAAGTSTGMIAGAKAGPAGPAGGGTNPAAATTKSGPGCTAPPGSDQGITATQIKIAVVLVDTSGSGAVALAFGVPPASEQQSYYQQVIDALNASGGTGCRKLVPVFFTGSPADQTDLQQKCLDIAQAGVFAVVDFGAYFLWPALAGCFPQHQLPFFSGGFLPNQETDRFYPYLFGGGSMETFFRNTVFALNARGFFSPANGFKKLGFLYRDCVPEVVNEFIGWLGQVGVSPSQVITYNLSCPTGFATPADLQQAILKFQQNGVTHLTEMQAAADFANFTTIAQQQHFNPKYGVPDEVVATTYGNTHPDYANIADAIAITPFRYGEERTPGMTPTAATAKCNAIFRARGRPPVYEQPVATGGVACNQVWELAAAIDHAPAMQRSALAAGLHATRSVEFSYPDGPNDFSGPRVTTGHEFWRPDQFFTSCNCWRVIDPTFHPSFP